MTLPEINLLSVSAPPLLETIDVKDVWLFRLMLNILGYSTLVVPAYFLIQYLRKIKYDQRGSGPCYGTIVSCVFGNSVPEASTSVDKKKETSTKSTTATTVILISCAGGLQSVFLIWGIFQERIMTQEYGKSADNPGEKFTNSQFLIFMNILFCFTISGCCVTLLPQQIHRCPQYKFSFCSFSVIMSSWFQYEALKYVSFPTQVLVKACKVIPVMLMGKVVSGNKYQFYEWATAGLLSVGISLFLLAQGEAHERPSVASNVEGTTIMAVISGILLMGGYIAFDSFTANWEVRGSSDTTGCTWADCFMQLWLSVFCLYTYVACIILYNNNQPRSRQKQLHFTILTQNRRSSILSQGELFKVHKMSSMQMMFGVNMFSCLFTSVSLLEQGGFFEAFGFVLRHFDFAIHSVILSLCSALGQLLIFYTISEFGAVVFTIIMTTRQALAILLSCIIYSHPVAPVDLLGILVVFIALFLRIYARSGKQVQMNMPIEDQTEKV